MRGEKNQIQYTNCELAEKLDNQINDSKYKEVIVDILNGKNIKKF